MDDNTQKKSGGRLVLGKITAIHDAFILTDPTLTPADIRDRTGLPASTVQRLVAILVEQGFLDRADEGYRADVRMAHWDAPSLQGAELVDTARPVLEALRDETGETAALFQES
ncbi:hypothetical protein Csp1_26810 [Corynebacterium provencense]|uniref:HTH iclR-type domain-containing protein n=1 Tax=Corynebacterium provencense TaxID=1737425 RepID=A0A2Z3YY02_9CORY|nr:MarR family transcriptional regulator [Corynebacterium provencense]AWT27424.1 hypothetical protein Csp1_26810 [Corynebacterium provencense]